MMDGDDLGYKIGSFNMRNLGAVALGRSNERDLRKIAEIIREESFDIVALQEVLSEGKAFTSSGYAKKSLLMELGSGWDFCWAEAETGNAPRHEGYGFLWNKRRLRLATAELPNGTIRTYKPRILEQVIIREEMKRRPFYARFTPEGMPGGCFMEIRLLCIHTYYGQDTLEDRLIRDRELDILLKEIYPQISDRIYGNNMPAYTILLGDYNVELRRAWKENMVRRSPAYLKSDGKDIIETSDWRKMRIRTVQDEFTTLKKGDSQNEDERSTGGYAHDYDHFSFEENRFEGIVMSARRVDAVRRYCGADFDKYLRTVSDHIPIMMEIEIR